MDEYGREPCPHRIYADAGSAFSMGLVGGSIFHTYRGFKNAPKGLSNRLINVGREIRMRSPVTGVQFAAWGGMFSVIDCTLVKIRKKEDPWNSIAAGALTGSMLCARMGTIPMITSGIFGGVILAFIEGAGLVMNKFTSIMGQPGGAEGAPLEDPISLMGFGGAAKDKEKQQQQPGGSGGAGGGGQSSNVHGINFGDPSVGTGTSFMTH